MRKFVLLLFLFVVSNFAFSQMVIKEGSFHKIDGCITLPVHYDDNDVAMAVIKISTENITEQDRAKLFFQGNLATFIEVEQHVGEVWVYVTSRAATFLKIQHPDFGTTEFTFPVEIEAKSCYEMILVNNSKIDEGENKAKINDIESELAQMREMLAAMQKDKDENTENPESEKTKPEKVKTEKVKPEKTKASDNIDKLTFINANVAYSVAPQLSYGLTFGQVKRFGWFVSAMSNFGFQAMNTQLEFAGNISYYTGEKATTRLSVMAGAVIRVAEPISLKVGAGYGMRNLAAWQDSNEQWVKILGYSYSGLDLSAGMMMTLGKMNVSLDAVTTSFKTMEVKVGIGVNFN